MLGVHPEKAQLAESIIKRQDAMMRETNQSSLCPLYGVPFCITRCSYCSFPAVVAQKGQRESYVAALLQEIEAAGEMIRRQHKSICAVYLGGGTPTALTDQQMQRVMEAMQRAFGTGYEYTLEAGKARNTIFLKRKAGHCKDVWGKQTLHQSADNAKQDFGAHWTQAYGRGH